MQSSPFLFCFSSTATLHWEHGNYSSHFLTTARLLRHYFTYFLGNKSNTYLQALSQVTTESRALLAEKHEAAGSAPVPGTHPCRGSARPAAGGAAGTRTSAGSTAGGRRPAPAARARTSPCSAGRGKAGQAAAAQGAPPGGHTQRPKAAVSVTGRAPQPPAADPASSTLPARASPLPGGRPRSPGRPAAPHRQHVRQPRRAAQRRLHGGGGGSGGSRETRAAAAPPAGRWREKGGAAPGGSAFPEARGAPCFRGLEHTPVAPSLEGVREKQLSLSGAGKELWRHFQRLTSGGLQCGGLSALWGPGGIGALGRSPSTGVGFWSLVSSIQSWFKQWKCKKRRALCRAESSLGRNLTSQVKSIVLSK